MNHRSSNRTLTVAFATLALAAPRPALAQTTYTIADLGTNAYPQGVNDSS